MSKINVVLPTVARRIACLVTFLFMPLTVLSVLQNGDSKYMITDVNNEFYNASGSLFDKIPFDPILLDLFMKYGVGEEILEI